VSSAWREDMLTRAGELEGLKSWIVAHGNGELPGGALSPGVADAGVSRRADLCLGELRFRDHVLKPAKEPETFC
jgi:hypothetical protein